MDHSLLAIILGILLAYPTKAGVTDHDPWHVGLHFVDVLLSLAGIASGLVVLFGFIAGNRLDGWTALFLATTSPSAA
jgi:hypothetical protein